MSNHNILLKKTDKGYVFDYQIVDENNAPIDLTNSTVTFKVGDKTVMYVNNIATITDAPNGEVQYTFTEQDTLTSGGLLGEFEVLFSDGKRLNYPRSGYIGVTILPNVDGDTMQVSIDLTSTVKNRLDTMDLNIVGKADKSYVDQQTGDLTTLQTTDKDSLVHAINNNVVSLAQKAQQSDLNTTNNTVALKADKTYVDTKLAGAVNASPIPVSLAANMTDHTRNYVYTGTESGYTAGHWYGWNGSAWADGGVYQSTGLADGSVTSTKRTVKGEFALLQLPWGVANFDFTNNKLVIPATTGGASNEIFYRNTYISLGTAEIDIDISLGGGYSRGLITFNVKTALFNVYSSATLSSVTEDEVIIGVFYKDGKRAYLNGAYTIDGKSPTLPKDGLAADTLADIYPMWKQCNVLVGGANFPIVDNTNKKLTFQANSYDWVVFVGGTAYPLSNTGMGFSIDLSTAIGTSAWCILFNITNQTFLLSAWNAAINYKGTHALFATFRIEKGKYIFTMPCPYIMDGQLYGYISPTSDLTPDYIKNDIGTTQGKVADLQNGDTISFVFVTDTHANPSRINQIKTHLNSVVKLNEFGVVDFVCHGGDVIDGYEADKNTVKTYLSDLSNILNQMDKPVFVLKGNHDDNSYYTSNPTITNVVSKQEWYGRMIKPFDNEFVHDTQNTTSAYFYKDFSAKKVRVVCLDAQDYPVIDNGDGTLKYCGQNFWGYGSRQVQWLANEALSNLPLGYKVLMLSHMPTRPELNAYSSNPINGSLIEGVLKACHMGNSFSGSTTDPDWGTTVNVDFAPQGARPILAYIYGHTHVDLISKPADLGWNYISTPNAFNVVVDLSVEPTGSTAPSPRTAGTDTEDCWDVITINTKTNVINCTRYGAGNDRTAS